MQFQCRWRDGAPAPCWLRLWKCYLIIIVTGILVSCFGIIDIPIRLRVRGIFSFPSIYPFFHIAPPQIIKGKYLSMNHLLYLRVHASNSIVEIWMIFHHDIRIPRHCNENRINPTPNRRHEYLTNLQANQKTECHHYRGESAAIVVPWFGELEIKIGEQSTEITDEGSSHGQDGTDKTVIHKSVNAAVLHHCPGVFSGRDVGFAVEGDVRESVTIDKSADVSNSIVFYPGLVDYIGGLELTVRPTR